MKSGWTWILMTGLVLFQWYMLGSWIYREERTISNGIFIKIPCRQVDPRDPFRGTYLNINPIPAQFEFTDSLRFAGGQEVWVNYQMESGDVYKFYSVQPVSEKPEMPVYIQSRIKFTYPLYPDSVYQATLEYPFSNLYVNEKAAPDLLEQYNKALSDTTIIVYAGLHVLNGKASLEGLWIGDRRLE